MRLRRSDPSRPGLTRKPRGQGFEYLDVKSGERVTDLETLDRIRALAIPPAWKDLWISPLPNGHLQAIGSDAAGRRQYRYHEEWRRKKDLEKFEVMLDFARSLPTARAHLASALAAGNGLGRARVLAASVRLLEDGFFRVGTEEYTEVNESFGLATIRREHVGLVDGFLVFDYVAKSAKQRDWNIPVAPVVAQIVMALKDRQGGGPELLAFQEDGAWRDVRSGDLNAYIKQITGGDYSAKDFRTWSATVQAAVTLAVAEPTLKSPTARKRAKSFACAEVAAKLGNTPTVARNSYIDPRVFDRFDSGWTVKLDGLGQGAEVGAPAFHGPIEAAVLDLLENPRESDAVERSKVA